MHKVALYSSLVLQQSLLIILAPAPSQRLLRSLRVCTPRVTTPAAFCAAAVSAAICAAAFALKLLLPVLLRMLPLTMLPLLLLSLLRPPLQPLLRLLLLLICKFDSQ